MRFSCIMAWYALRPAFVLPPPSPPSSPPPLFRRAARRAASSSARLRCHSARVAPSRAVAAPPHWMFALEMGYLITRPIPTRTRYPTAKLAAIADTSPAIVPHRIPTWTFASMAAIPPRKRTMMRVRTITLTSLRILGRAFSVPEWDW